MGPTGHKHARQTPEPVEIWHIQALVPKWMFELGG
jgi:hypothetical protein